MLLLRMVVVALRLAWPFLLTPWRSPLLRWRMETYGLTDAHGRCLHADEVTPARFFAFLIHRRRELLRFLAWAASL
jgi:hypothetical protein